MGTIYRYVDTSDNDTIKYVGIVWSKNRSLKQRIKEHEKDAWYNEGTWRIEKLNDDNIKVNSRTDAEYLESHFIALYGTHRYFNKSKTGWGICSFVPEIDEKKWLKVKDYAEEILLEEKRKELLKRLVMILETISSEKEKKEQEKKKKVDEERRKQEEKKKIDEERKTKFEKIIYTKESIALTFALMKKVKIDSEVILEKDTNLTLNWPINKIKFTNDGLIKRNGVLVGQEYDDELSLEDFVSYKSDYYFSYGYYFTDNELFHAFYLLAKEFFYDSINPDFIEKSKKCKVMITDEKDKHYWHLEDYTPKELTIQEFSDIVLKDEKINTLYLMHKCKVVDIIINSLKALMNKYEELIENIAKEETLKILNSAA